MRGILISLLLLAMVGAVAAETGGAPPAPLYWRVESRHPVAGGRSGERATLRWRYEVTALERAGGGLVWRVQVSPEEADIRLRASFRFDPQAGRLDDLVIEQWLQGQWRVSRPTVPRGDVQTLRFGGVPLDFVASVHRHQAKSGRPMAAVEEATPDDTWRFRREWRVELADSGQLQSGPAAGLADKLAADAVLEVRDPRRPGQDRRFWWRAGWSWWVACETPAWSARVVEIGWPGGGRDE